MAVEAVPCGPASHSRVRASRPWIAAQVLRATTARPPSGLNLAPSPLPGISTTFITPGTATTAAVSAGFTLPPTTGGRTTTAVRMPGTVTPAALIALPVVGRKMGGEE